MATGFKPIHVGRSIKDRGFEPSGVIIDELAYQKAKLAETRYHESKRELILNPKLKPKPNRKDRRALAAIGKKK